MEKVVFNLVDYDKNGNANLHGLNWGNRQDGTPRDKNEAYLQLTPEIYNTDFFPPKGKFFIVKTDDEQTLIFVRAQKPIGTALQTPENNSILGKYLRKRIGIEEDVEITVEKLKEYRETISFYKQDNMHYFLDYSKNDDSFCINTSSLPTPHTHPRQIIFYGVPGCGKSHKITEMLRDTTQFKIESEEHQVSRTVFHPDYTNSDFIGQILPKVNEDKTIEYNFVPGPFTKILANAYKHSENQYVLVIEEINRGNAAAIFGEIFQLLDRIRTGRTVSEKVNDGALNAYGEGWSEYFFMNDEINQYILKECNGDDSNKTASVNGIAFSVNTGIRLPPNLSILATMNTSDQNVFTLDNAFQRRWEMEYLPNNAEYESMSRAQKNQYDSLIGATNVKWGDFRKKINGQIANPDFSFSNAEDKQLGLFFVQVDGDISEGAGTIKENDFANKVLKYLWNDIFKRNHEDIFADEIKTFGDLICAFNGSDALKKCFKIAFD